MVFNLSKINARRKTKATTPSDAWLKILAEGAHSDITLVADGVERPAHMCVLAVNSVVFSRKFETELAGQRDRVVHMEDMTSVALDAFLRYLYGGDTTGIKKDARIAAGLLKAADEYMIEGLSEICERVILNTRPRKMSIDVALDVFQFGSLLNKRAIENHGVKALKMNPNLASSLSLHLFRIKCKHPMVLERLLVLTSL